MTSKMSQTKDTKSDVTFVKLEEPTKKSSRFIYPIIFMLLFSIGLNIILLAGPGVDCISNVTKTIETEVNQLQTDKKLLKTTEAADSNEILNYKPETIESCVESLERAQKRIIGCLAIRSVEITTREEALDECIAELKTTEYELNMYKNDEIENDEMEYDEMD